MWAGERAGPPNRDRESEDGCWDTAGSRAGGSPALQVAEVQQVELPAVLAVVNVVHVLPRRMHTWIRLSTGSWGGLRSLVLLQGAEPLGSPLPNPKIFPDGWQRTWPSLEGQIGEPWTFSAGNGQKATHPRLVGVRMWGGVSWDQCPEERGAGSGWVPAGFSSPGTPSKVPDFQGLPLGHSLGNNLVQGTPLPPAL